MMNNDYIKYNIQRNKIIYCDPKMKGKVVIPDTVTEIGEKAFVDCRHITEVVFPESLIAIRKAAFRDCYGLTEVNLPESLKIIEEEAFAYSVKIKKIVFNSSIEVLPPRCLCCWDMTEITFPKDLKIIGKEVFFNCNSLKVLTIPEGVKRIEEKAFFQCEWMFDLNLPSSLTFIGKEVFKGCDALSRIVIPKSMSIIEEGNWSNFDRLYNIICLSATPPTIKGNPKYGFDQDKAYKRRLFVAESSYSLYANHPIWGQFTIEIFPDELPSVYEKLQEAINDCFTRELDLRNSIHNMKPSEIEGLIRWAREETYYNCVTGDIHHYNEMAKLLAESSNSELIPLKEIVRIRKDVPDNEIWVMSNYILAEYVMNNFDKFVIETDEIDTSIEENVEPARTATKGKHKVGDKHPTQPWVWTEYKPGKFDWRKDKTAKETTGTAPVDAPSHIEIKYFNLERFVTAQEKNEAYETAIEEIKNGKKITDWMPFVFPQLKGTANAEGNQEFEISSLYEAHAFFNHPELGERLRDAVKTLNTNLKSDNLYLFFEEQEVEMLHSSLTLFDAVASGYGFREALEKFFDEQRDEKTLASIAKDMALFNKDVWENYGIMYYRKYFDHRCHEAEGFSSNERQATFIDLYKRGYTANTLTWKYLSIHRDLFDLYRTSNAEYTIELMAQDLLENVIDWLKAQNDQPGLSQVELLFPDEYFELDSDATWEMATFRFDSFVKFLIENKSMSKFVETFIAKYSKLRPTKEDSEEYIPASVAPTSQKRGGHYVGEKHPTQPWVWTEYKPGKFDWRKDKSN